jgi:DNA replication and repair protein RecF
LNLEEIPDGMNIIFGKNAQGKTNLIEAISICAGGKSFRAGADSGTIMTGRKNAYIYVGYVLSGRNRSVEALIEKGSKSFKKDGIPQKSIKDMLGSLHSVVFSPEDMRTAKESPSLRRAFLDSEISKIRPSYVDALKKYTEIVSEKNTALKKSLKINVTDLIEAYNEQLARYIKIILKNRLAYIAKLNEYVIRTHEDISGGAEQIELKYGATIGDEDIEGQLQKLVKRETHELQVACGPHRDDMKILIDGQDARAYASQGQLRTIMLAVKIACLKILADSTCHTPIMLLDDVFSELDGTRKDHLVKALRGFQAFITTADRNDIARVPNAGMIRVSDGSAAFLEQCPK